MGGAHPVILGGTFGQEYSLGRKTTEKYRLKIALKQHTLRREKNNALEAFIYKDSRASKKVDAKKPLFLMVKSMKKRNGYALLFYRPAFVLERYQDAAYDFRVWLHPSANLENACHC